MKNWTKILEEVNNGATIVDICNKYKLNNSTVRNNLIKLGWIPIRTFSNMNEKERNNMKSDKENGMSINELAFKYKRTPTHVRHLFKHIIKD